MSRTAPEPDTRSDIGTDGEAEHLVEASVELAARWLTESRSLLTRAEGRTATRLRALVDDDADAAFALGFVDRVIRPDDDRTAAAQLAGLVAGGDLPGFLSPIDRALLRAGAWLAPHLPGIVVPLARRRLRALVGHLVVDADPSAMADHVTGRRRERFDLNVNLLGEAVLGAREADRRLTESMRLLDQPEVDYVSVKVSAVAPRLNPWDHEGSLGIVTERLRPLLSKAAATTPATFVNLDMEEYHDLELTLDAFIRLLDEPDLHHVDAGIVLQAYLPDSFPALQRLEAWASDRRNRTVDGRNGGTVKVRLVKGANLAMERVDATVHGWAQAPYRTKAETDANYKRCLDWLLRPEHLGAMRVGVASHNLFDCAFALLLARHRGVADAVTIEMLEGMAPAQARRVRDETGELLLYTPVVDDADFDVAVSYLFRRLEENTSDENFIRHLFDLEPSSERFGIEADRFRSAVAERWSVGTGPQRHQDRAGEAAAPPSGPVGSATFANEPDTDPALPANRAWVADVLAAPVPGPQADLVDDTAVIDRVVATARAGQPDWWARGGSGRRWVLLAVGDELARRRGDLLAAMVAEGHKTVAQADPEISEAIDFARYYAERAADLPDGSDGSELPDGSAGSFAPLGVVLVVPPWNFPVAIPAGGVLAALAAGNAVVLKPAPETPRCAEIVAECCWAAGVPPEVLGFVRTPDDEVGRHLVAHPGIDTVILTGASETARLFQSWRPERPVLAETSGKNALVITPSADIDLAVADLVASAFGHGGQKCSAASLAIVVDPVADSPRFQRQLIDAVESLRVGPAGDLATDLAPVIAEPTGKLARALTELDPGERWLVEPRRLGPPDGPALWSPGVRVGVQPGSWFHQTECFGPVLGIVAARDLDHAIEIQNGTAYGLTGGLHSLDRTEVEHWLERVEVGNAYVNRVTTGAIVQRQPFGGWKGSSVGPGAKAGGPNYVAQLGRWSGSALPPEVDEATAAAWLHEAEASDAHAWAQEFGRDHDPTGLFCEDNLFRYRPLPAIVVRLEAGTSPWIRRRIEAASRRCGVAVEWSDPERETQDELAARLGSLGVDRVRLVGPVGGVLRRAAIERGVHLAADPVLADGRRELLHYLREQSVSRTRHRYGNIIDRPVIE